MTSLPAASRMAPLVRLAAEEAGRMAMRWFVPGGKTGARVWNKGGGSPVTEADIAVDEFLKARLTEILPEAAWLSEETADDAVRLGGDLVWIVDPIDGTRAFLTGHADWSVAIGLLWRGEPVLGVVHAPAHQALYEGVRGAGATLNGRPLAASTRRDLAGALIAGPAPLLDLVAREGGPISRAPRVPSLALRIARIAEGALDAGLVSSDARDWDLAAADLILREAGGLLTSLDGAALRYNQSDPVHGELAAAGAGLHPRLLEAMTRRETTARG